MKSFKDFFYDKNDILLALAILILAGLLIFWRMNVIMDYPQTLAQETGTTDTTDEAAVAADPAKDGQTGEKEKTDEGSSSIWSNGKLTKDVTVSVQGGSATAAVQTLIDAGLFKSYDEYSKICNAAGYTPEDIKATTFTFEAGCTQTDIAKKVTQ